MYTISKNKVRLHMEKNGISTQKQLAEQLGISKNQLSMLLSPNFNPIKSNALKLCEILEVNFEEIIESEQMELSLDGTDNLIDSNIDEEINVSSFEGNEFLDIRDIKANKNYSVVELFAGAGGLALGLEQAGFKSRGLVEFDKYACQTLRKNRPHWNVIEKDIIDVAEEGIKNYVNVPIGELDLLSGGYPCQAFSYAGKKMGLSDARGTMFYYYAQVLKQLLPKMFLAENVRGLVNHDNGRTLALMLKVFSDIGYTVKWKVLRALDYDVAQKRERIVLVGIRNDLIEKYETDYFFPQPYGYELTLNDVLKNVPESEGAKYPESKKRVLDLVPPGGYWRDLPDEIAKDYMGKSYYSGGGRTGMARRLSWDEPSLTLTCSPAQKQTERCHPDETRPFTVREYARIQSFPDSWNFDCSTNNAYKQIGNAVPVNMAKAIGLSIISTLNQIT
ncbi:DNA (cytosine-5-)-methyltransferase [Bacillus velezensis]|nr:DNA (cytosine-5-)-methyltransferase [Bacillus velezensis]MEC1925756.1 DNA (cytosine-5-)-methyltransferase [Bacillus velezensis]ULN60900.1 DNA (cytosine-5-)-methyltransferase [Bacillus velezensis]UYQ97118.1 DNA (cytosine-5-)-methyltransferase [Bacillus velezensis]WDV42227.1 DNA (cytosine-5-)-methyltransferase [Bacillus velezensis]